MADLRAAYAVITAQALPELRDSAVRAGIRFAYNFKSLRCNDAAVNVQTAAPVTGAASVVHRYAGREIQQTPAIL